MTKLGNLKILLIMKRINNLGKCTFAKVEKK